MQRDTHTYAKAFPYTQNKQLPTENFFVNLAKMVKLFRLMLKQLN